MTTLISVTATHLALRWGPVTVSVPASHRRSRFNEVSQGGDGAVHLTAKRMNFKPFHLNKTLYFTR